MEDNIVSFPGRRQKRILSQELMQVWKAGLESKSYERQWSTFEQMDYFSDLYVLQLIQEFLLSAHGDPLLKTKIVQTVKRECPIVGTVEIEKGGFRATISLAQVPIQLEDWPPYCLAVYSMIQEKAEQDPTLIEMAQELWLYFLEKCYPFIPDLQKTTVDQEQTVDYEQLLANEKQLSPNQALKWTAALHLYTLKIINSDFAQKQVEQELPTMYLLPTEEILEYTNCLESFLFQQ